MLKVVHFITTLSRGGAENQLLILCREQIRAGLRVTVVPLSGAPELMKEFSSSGILVDLCMINQNFLTQLYLIRRLNLGGDIWHAHLPQAELLLASTKGTPVVVTRHFGGKFYPRAPMIISNGLSRYATHNARGIVAISDFVAQYLNKSGELNKSKRMRVIPYGFDSQAYLKTKKVAVVEAEPKSNAPIFGTLARLSPEKDLETLIKGFHTYVAKTSKNAQLHIYGEGSEGPKLEFLVKSLNLSEQVSFKGRTNDSASTIGQFDTFILTSRFEGFGMVLLESMSVGVPIICSRIPAALEVLGTEGAAIFFEVGNEIDLAEKMEKSEKFFLDDFRIEQKKRLKLFDSKTMSDNLHEFYLELLNKSNSNSPD